MPEHLRPLDLESTGPILSSLIQPAKDFEPWRQQAVLGRDRWDADALRDLVRDYAIRSMRSRVVL
jgi:hypothetical protein